MGTVVWLIALLPLAWWTGMAEGATDLETPVCGRIREPLAFWLFRRAAGSPDPARLQGLAGVEPVFHRTADGRRLGGYRLRAENPRGYLLIAQGNAMLADQILPELAYFRDRGLEVYVFDYRGYGLSEGRSRLKAIVSDYRELVRKLDAEGYRRRYLYGMSMGGIILLNAVGRTDLYDAMVVDSSPSRISTYGCPAAYDPVAHLPEDASRIMVLVGLRDTVVPPGESKRLARTVERRGGTVRVVPEFAHPFQDVDPTLRRRRLQMVADFLLLR